MSRKCTLCKANSFERIKPDVLPYLRISSLVARIFKNKYVTSFIAFLCFNLFVPSDLSAQIVQTFNTSGSFVVPAGCTSIKIESWGAGGGGGCGSAVVTATGSGGGGGGGAFNSTIFTVIPGQTYTITIGAAGVAGIFNVSGGNGGNGANTIVNGAAGTLTANGGSGGGAGSAVNGTTVNGTGGAGGAGNKNGGNGLAGQGATSGAGGGGAGNNANGGTPTGGAGNPNVIPYFGGNGGTGVTGNAAGAVGTQPGGAGSGGHVTSATNRNGGVGGAGRVVITYCITPPTPTAGTISSINPSSCGSFTGSITLSGYTASTAYKIQYTKNGVSTNYAINTNASGAIVISNQGAGTYSSFQVTLLSTNCPSGIYNGTVTLTQSCSDFDGDGVPDIVDIDDDNDGVPDATESSSCFYSYAEIRNPLSVTSTILPSLINLNDNLSTTYTTTGGLNSLNQSVLEVTPKTAVAINGIEIEMSSTSSFLPTTALAYQLQGWNGAGWINLTDSIAAPSSTPATAGGKVTFTVTKNFNVYLKYRIFGTASATIVNNRAIREVRFVINNYSQSSTPKTTCSLSNHQSLDSDNDGCSDAFESGATFNTTTNYSFPSAGVGSNGLADLVETVPGNGIINYSSNYRVYALNNTLRSCIDSELDGVYDVNDLDDDNDGIRDVVESPLCYYSATEANVISKVTSELTSPDDDQSDGDIQLLHNTTVETSGSAFNFAANHFINNSALFIVKYFTPVPLTSLTLVKVVSLGAGNTAVMQGSNDSLVWTTISATVILSNNSSAVFTNTGSNAFLFYRILGNSNTLSSITGYVGEITSILNTPLYVASANPKPSCVSDLDGDGIKNHLDLDADGDGCADALEGEGGYNQGDLQSSILSGGPTNVISNLGNIVGATFDTRGIPTIANTGQGLGSSQNGGILSNCDAVDIDDDDDGILDEVECPITSDLNYATYGNNSGTTTFPATSVNNTYVSSAANAVAGPGITATRNTTNNFLSITNMNLAGSTLATAETANDYMQYVITTTADTYNWINAIRVNTSNTGVTASYNYAIAVSTNNFATRTFLNSNIPYVNGQGLVVTQIEPLQLFLNTTYTFRIYFFNASASPIAHDDFALLGYSECDTDGDGLPNRLDLDSDGDGCPDLVESGVINQVNATFSPGVLINSGSTITKAYAKINGPYGDNGFANSIETNDLESAAYNGSYTYSNATNSNVKSSCDSYTPNGVIAGGAICITNPGKLTFTSTNGTGPFKLVINGVTYSNIVSGVPFNALPLPLTTTIYNLTSITDSNNYSQP
mgnify:CR=1 FL=1